MLDWRWLSRPRHPLVRVLMAVFGLALVGGVLVLGFFALLAFAFIGGIVALTRAIARTHSGAVNPPRPATTARVIEGEFVVVDNSAAKH